MIIAMIAMTGLAAKKRQTKPSRKTISYQWVISIKPSAGPENSVITPLTISWWAWWEVEISKGDLRSLIVRT